MFQQQTFHHHGFVFLIETEGWPDENSGRSAMGSMRLWVELHSPADTTTLFVLLMQESEAIVREADFDHDQGELPGVRSAQRSAIAAGIGARKHLGELPMVSLQAFAIAIAEAPETPEIKPLLRSIIFKPRRRNSAF